MNIKILAIIIGVVILAAGGAYWLFGGNSAGTDSQVQDQSQDQTPTFNAQSTVAQAFVATMVTEAEGDQFTATIKSDGKGNVQYQSSLDGRVVNMYLTADGMISCQGTTCFRMPTSQAQAQINQDAYEYDEADIDQFRSQAEYLGQESCPAGACSVWSVEDQDEQYTTKVYLAADGLVSKLTSEGPQGNATVTYEYQPVTVTVPTNIQELPGGF